MSTSALISSTDNVILCIPSKYIGDVLDKILVNVVYECYRSGDHDTFGSQVHLTKEYMKQERELLCKFFY